MIVKKVGERFSISGVPLLHHPFVQLSSADEAVYPERIPPGIGQRRVQAIVRRMQRSKVCAAWSSWCAVMEQAHAMELWEVALHAQPQWIKDAQGPKCYIDDNDF